MEKMMKMTKGKGVDNLMKEYIEIPENLDRKKFAEEFGNDCYCFYLSRLKERQMQGKIYENPLKTAYIWATKDRKTHQGFYSTYVGKYKNGRKAKNYGRS